MKPGENPGEDIIAQTGVSRLFGPARLRGWRVRPLSGGARDRRDLSDRARAPHPAFRAASEAKPMVPRP